MGNDRCLVAQQVERFARRGYPSAGQDPERRCPSPYHRSRKRRVDRPPKAYSSTQNRREYVASVGVRIAPQAECSDAAPDPYNRCEQADGWRPLPPKTVGYPPTSHAALWDGGDAVGHGFRLHECSRGACPVGGSLRHRALLGAMTSRQCSRI